MTLSTERRRSRPDSNRADRRRFVVVAAAVIALLMPLIWLLQPWPSIAGRIGFTIGAVVLVPFVMWVKAGSRAEV